MTTSNFKTFALAITALFTFALTSCEKNEIANLTPYDLTEVKATSLSLDPHDLIDDENAITKPYNNLNKKYDDFTNSLSDDIYPGIPKPPGPVYTNPETRRVDVNKPNFAHSDEKIVREDPGPLYTDDAEDKMSIIDTPTFSDGTKPAKPVKPFNIFSEAELKVRQLNFIDGEVHEDGVTLVDRDGWPIK